MNSIFSGLANRVTSEEQFIEIEGLMEMYEINEAVKNATIDTMNNNLMWREKYSTKIQEFLDDYLNTATKLTTTWLIGVMMMAVKLFN